MVKTDVPVGSEATPVTVIQPRKGLVGIDFQELYRYRELLYFLTWRDVKVRYKQTVLGAAWAILQPFLTMVVFTLFFGKMAKMPSDGIPYPIFSYAGLLPWSYFANALSNSGNSLVGSANLITKVYFPRLIIPMGATLAGLVDFAIAMVVLGGMMVYYHFVPSWGMFLFPVLVFFTFLLATGTGLYLSALNVKYRDVRYVIPFFIQLWLFASPVIYPTSLLHGPYRWVLSLNPMVGLIETYRASMLGHKPIPWEQLGLACGITVLVFLSGILYFRRMEREFADVV
ncbi:MAG TPA: ABC transporter permease [Armatimonadetes bacterium]|nr:ABC transporter permease [Armatimonadota bacterium]